MLLQKQKGKWIKRNGIYYRKIRKKEKIILSEKCRIDLIKEVHKEWGNTGITKTKMKPILYRKEVNRKYKENMQRM